MSALRLAVLLSLLCATAVGMALAGDRRMTIARSMTLLPDLRLSRADMVEMRLKQRLTADMLSHFDLFLYVSKSASGLLAQRMYVFQRAPGGLTLAHEWAASTGRELVEINARGRAVITATPAGFYQLDPRRMYSHYHSASWDQDMPSTMFFNWERGGMQTGLAIHAAAGGDIAKLGRRASAGCVHLAPAHAAALYALIRENYRGVVPRFAYDEKIGTSSNRGDFMRDGQGRLKMADGYRVLVVLEDYGGQEEITAAALF